MERTDAPDAPIWCPSPERVEAARLTAFRRRVAGEAGRPLDDPASLHRWSIEAPEAFWDAVWSFCEVRGERGSERVLRHGDRMPGARWFPDARLSFADNLLRRDDDAPALIFRSESGARRELSFRALRQRVADLAAAFGAAGVGPGDRVAGHLPNLPEAVIGMLATASLGALWSSTSPDFGPQGVLDRFGQIEPKLLLCADGYFYGGRRFDTLARLPEILAGLPSLERAVVVPYTTGSPALPDDPRLVSLADFAPEGSGAGLSPAALPFDHPLYILFSSGTTGRPKCIVHGAGGTLIQHLKEHRLHVDLGTGDQMLYFTTCGWMMWNWLASALASETTLVLYDGSPFHPDGRALFDVCEQERVTVFGTSAKFLDACAKQGVAPVESHDLGALRTVLSTGSPLLPEGFDYVYGRVKGDVHLASISGGTDIVSCFVLGDPCAPVHRGEIQCRGLGMAVEVFDPKGEPIVGEKGELVCTRPFPSMPVGFWRDDDGSRYRSAYFERFPGVWRHGDWTLETARGGFVIYGRSDAVLNPGGVRIGTAEIYRPVERLDEVLECIAVGQEWEGDVRVVLFVVLREGGVLDDALTRRIKDAVRAEASPRHVPAVVLQVADIPRTRSGKITELAVRDVVHGREVENTEALANPEALEQFRNRL